MDLSIIILNYNTSDLTIACIDSIKIQTSEISYEIIVVDNASKDEDYQNLKNLINDKEIKLVKSLQNSGFSSGNNKGVDFATGKYVCFVNSDILLLENSFKILFDFMEKNPDAGVCSGVQLYEDLKQSKINFGHYHNLTREVLGDQLLELIFNKPKRKISHDNPIKVDFCSGCFMFFNTEYYKLVGGFDNSIFLYYEEMDICYRLKKYNLFSYHVPNTKFIHLEGASTKIGYQRKVELTISLLYILRKNNGFVSYLGMKYFFLLKFFFKGIFKPKHFKMFLLLLTLGSPLAHSLKNKQQILGFRN